MEDLYALYARYDGPLPRDRGFATGRLGWEALLCACLRRQREKRSATQGDLRQTKQILAVLRREK